MSWVTHELQGTQMPDERLNKRLEKLLTSLSKNGEESIPAACQGWTETKSAYRFFDNARVGFDEILSGHKEATLGRIAREEMVLLAQDTTFLDYGSKEAVGLGTLKRTRSEHYLLHPTVAFTPLRANLGVLGADFWQRPEDNVAHLRHKKPIEEKESYRWLKSYELACEVQRQCPDTLVLSVADREGDIHEWFLLAQNKPLEERAELLVRAKCNRRTQKKDGEYSYLWDEMAGCRVMGKLVIRTPRTGGKPSRPATLEVRAKEIEFCGRKGKKTEPVFMYAVYATEKRTPKGEAAIEWMLLTTIPVETYEAAEAIIGWYCARWEIEIFFRVLKQGCQIEELRLETDRRLLNCIGICLIVAWRIHVITMQSREWPDIRCDILFSEKEWKTIYLMHKKSKPPKRPPTLKEISRMLAQLGGFLARKRDGDPGVKNIWRGYRALQNYVDALEVAKVGL